MRRRWVFSSSPSAQRIGEFRIAASETARRLLGSLLNLALPEDCRVCGNRLLNASRIPVCRACLSEPQPFAPEYFCTACRTPFVNAFPLDESGLCLMCRLGLAGFDAAYSFGSYEGTLRKLIHLFKYEGIEPLAGPLGGLMALTLPRAERFDLIVPMPLHWWRQWRRGFNQSESLARALSGRSGIPVINAMRRRKATSPQAGLTNARRRANVAAAFEVRRRPNVEGKRILLVDDVLTTGATAGSCARSLKRAGAKYVAILTLARADRRLNLPLEAGLSEAAAAASTHD